MKLNLLLLLLFTSFILKGVSQNYQIETRDILLNYDITSINDSTILLTGKIINKINYNIYIAPPSNIWINCDLRNGYPESYKILEGGIFWFDQDLQHMALKYLTELKANDTISFQNKIGCKNFNFKYGTIISFDYVNSEKYNSKIKKEILKSLHHIPGHETSKDFYTSNEQLLGKLCDYIVITIPGKIW
jgi:hypothetical protein